MKNLFTYIILFACLLAGGEAFPRKISDMGRIYGVPGKKQSKAVQARVSASDIISEAPAGTHKSYYREGTSYDVEMDYETFDIYLKVIDDQYVVGDVVEGDDGFFYFRNPVIGMPTYSYMKGEKEGNEIVFHFPQAIVDTDGYAWGVSKMRLVKGGYLGTDAEIVKDNNEIRFKINEDGSYTQIEEEGYIMGYYYLDDDSWAWTGTSAQTYHPLDEVSAQVPADAEIIDGQLLYEGQNGLMVKMAVVGDDFYLGDVYPGIDNAWAVGKIADGKVTFDSYQYLGASEAMYHYVFFVGASIEDCMSDAQSQGYPSISFDYDAEASTLRPASADDAIVINASGHDIYWLDYYANPTISPFVLEPATPVNPEIISYYDYFDWYGYARFDFRLPVISTDGNLLDKEHYLYNIILDDEAMEFYPDEYPSLTEMITDIPYRFNCDGGGISTSERYVMEGTHEVVIYTGGYDKIGVQGLYVVDGVTNYTDVVYYGESGVREIAENEGEISSVLYFDLSGRRMTNPSTGIFIKETVFKDGSSKAQKISVR